MKTINVSFEDAEIKKIEKVKKEQSWRKFILERAAIDSSNEIHNKGINADALRGLCLEYDLEYGTYPEGQYQGFSLLRFFLKEVVKVPVENEDYDGVWAKRIIELKKVKKGE